VAEEYDSQILKINKGAPMHFMQNITYTKDNIAMDYFESRFRGDKGKVRVVLYNEI
jgi:DNA-binding GntR family transcriptional regulator